MTMMIKTLSTLSLTAALLAGCTSMNVFKDDAAPPPAVENDLAPEEPEVALQKSSSVRSSGLKAAEINKVISGKSWKWTATNSEGAVVISGVTLYANDGSSLVEISGKGTTTGKWLAKDGQLCESMSAAPPFLPKGKDMFCNPIIKNANGYDVGAAKFTLAN